LEKCLRLRRKSISSWKSGFACVKKVLRLSFFLKNKK
jgi:hypothetical protein